MTLICQRKSKWLQKVMHCIVNILLKNKNVIIKFISRSCDASYKKTIIELFVQLTSGSNEKLFFHVDKILSRIKEPFSIFWCSNAKGEDDSVG